MTDGLASSASERTQRLEELSAALRRSGGDLNEGESADLKALLREVVRMDDGDLADAFLGLPDPERGILADHRDKTNLLRKDLPAVIRRPAFASISKSTLVEMFDLAQSVKDADALGLTPKFREVMERIRSSDGPAVRVEFMQRIMMYVDGKGYHEDRGMDPAFAAAADAALAPPPDEARSAAFLQSIFEKVEARTFELRVDTIRLTPDQILALGLPVDVFQSIDNEFPIAYPHRKADLLALASPGTIDTAMVLPGGVAIGLASAREAIDNLDQLTQTYRHAQAFANGLHCGIIPGAESIEDAIGVYHHVVDGRLTKDGRDNIADRERMLAAGIDIGLLSAVKMLAHANGMPGFPQRLVEAFRLDTGTGGRWSGERRMAEQTGLVDRQEDSIFGTDLGRVLDDQFKAVFAGNMEFLIGNDVVAQRMSLLMRDMKDDPAAFGLTAGNATSILRSLDRIDAHPEKERILSKFGKLNPRILTQFRKAMAEVERDGVAAVPRNEVPMHEAAKMALNAARSLYSDLLTNAAARSPEAPGVCEMLHKTASKLLAGKRLSEEETLVSRIASNLVAGTAADLSLKEAVGKHRSALRESRGAAVPEPTRNDVTTRRRPNHEILKCIEDAVRTLRARAIGNAALQERIGQADLLHAFRHGIDGNGYPPALLAATGTRRLHIEVRSVEEAASQTASLARKHLASRPTMISLDKSEAHPKDLAFAADVLFCTDYTHASGFKKGEALSGWERMEIVAKAFKEFGREVSVGVLAKGVAETDKSMDIQTKDLPSEAVYMKIATAASSIGGVMPASDGRFLKDEDKLFILTCKYRVRLDGKPPVARDIAGAMKAIGRAVDERSIRDYLEHQASGQATRKGRRPAEAVPRGTDRAVRSGASNEGRG